MEIYAPLAERIGMQRFKSELQDIAFSELQSEGYQSIFNRLEYLRNSNKMEINDTVDNLTKVLEAEGIKCEVMGREKTPYSIWGKMQRKNISFEQLTDVVAFRIVVSTMLDCYKAMGAIHAKYHIVPGTFKDFISIPKENGYRSLHTVVIGPNHQRIEIQIRTADMHEIAEYGVAAHWMYKQKKKQTTDGTQYKWIREIISIIEDTASTPEEFLENTKLEMYHDQVFCFTPKGKLIPLPKGSTPVDFAFAVHSDVGRTCVGAKINGKIVPLRTKLRNGDQVDIICSKSQKPSPIWERFVVTGKAKSEIRKYTRNEERKEYINLGQKIIEKICADQKVAMSDEVINLLMQKFKKKDRDDLFASIGQGNIKQNETVKALSPEKEKTDKKRMSLLEKLRMKKSAPSSETTEKNKTPIPIKGLISGMAVHFAPCCHPLPGEKIVGIMSSGQGIVIHTSDCDELNHFSEEPERWIDVSWETSADGDSHIGRLKAILAHKAGSLGTLANVIAQEDGNINNIRITDRATDYFEMIVDVEVKDINHLSTIMASLRSKDSILSVERFRGGIKHE